MRTAKSSCFGKISDRDGAARVDAVAAAHLRERPGSERPGIEPEHRDFVWVHPDDRHAALPRLEAVERVEDPQQVQRHHVVRIPAERGVEHATRLGLRTQAQQVHPEVGVRRHVRRLERDGPAPERHGFVEAVLAGRVGRNGAVGVAARRVDGERAGGLGFILRRPPGNPRDGRQQRVRLRASRVDCEHAIHGRLRLGRLVLVERRFGNEQVRVDEPGVDLEGAAGGRSGSRRIVVRQRAREADVRRSPAGVRLDGDAERPHRLARLVLLEEERAPRRVHRRVVLERVRRVAVERVGGPRLVEGVGRTRGSQQPFGGHAAASRAHERHQHARGIIRAAQLAVQQAELQRRLAQGTARGGRLQQRQGVFVLATVDRQAAEDRCRRRVARTTSAGERFCVGSLAVGDRRGRGLRERQLGCCPPLLCLRLCRARLGILGLRGLARRADACLTRSRRGPREDGNGNH